MPYGRLVKLVSTLLVLVLAMLWMWSVSGERWIGISSQRGNYDLIARICGGAFTLRLGTFDPDFSRDTYDWEFNPYDDIAYQAWGESGVPSKIGKIVGRWNWSLGTYENSDAKQTRVQVLIITAPFWACLLLIGGIPFIVTWRAASTVLPKQNEAEQGVGARIAALVFRETPAVFGC